MRLWRLVAADTHLYPGARLRCLDEPGAQRFATADAVLVEFGDGNTVAGRIASAAPGNALLSLEAHATARGAAIAAKSWLLQPGAAPGTLRVKARAS